MGFCIDPLVGLNNDSTIHCPHFRINMRLRFLSSLGGVLSKKDLPKSLKIIEDKIKTLRMPIYPGGWPKDPTRDVSSVMLNALLEFEITSLRNWTSEINIASGRIDFGHHVGGKLAHALEVELGNAARLDSDILKLCLLKHSNPSMSISIMVPSDNVKKKFHAEKSANDVVQRLATLRPVVDGVDDIIIIELDVPMSNEKGYTKHLLNGKSRFSKDKHLFLKNAKKTDLKKFIKKNRSNFKV